MRILKAGDLARIFQELDPAMDVIVLDGNDGRNLAIVNARKVVVDDPSVDYPRETGDGTPVCILDVTS